MANLDVPLDELIKGSGKPRRGGGAAATRQQSGSGSGQPTTRVRPSPSRKRPTPATGRRGALGAQGSPSKQQGRKGAKPDDAMSKPLDELIAKRTTRTVAVEKRARGGRPWGGPRSRPASGQRGARGNTSATTVGAAQLRRRRGAPIGITRATANLMAETNKLTRYFSRFAAAGASRGASVSGSRRLFGRQRGGAAAVLGDGTRRVSAMSRVQKPRRDIGDQLRSRNVSRRSLISFLKGSRITASSPRNALIENTRKQQRQQTKASGLPSNNYFGTSRRGGANLAKDRPRTISRNGGGTVIRSGGRRGGFPGTTEPPTIRSTVQSSRHPGGNISLSAFTTDVASFSDQERTLLNKIKIMANLVDTTMPPQSYNIGPAVTGITLPQASVAGSVAAQASVQPGSRGAYVAMGASATSGSGGRSRIGDRY